MRSWKLLTIPCVLVSIGCDGPQYECSNDPFNGINRCSPYNIRKIMDTCLDKNMAMQYKKSDSLVVSMSCNALKTYDGRDYLEYKSNNSNTESGIDE